jgi:hypothetical protein
MTAMGRYLPVAPTVGFSTWQPAMLAERPGSAKSGPWSITTFIKTGSQ